MKILRSVAIFAAAFGMMVGVGALGQGHGSGQGNSGGMDPNQTSGQTGQSSSSSTTTGSSNKPTMPNLGALDDVTNGARNPRTDEEMEKMRNLDRQKKLVADTDRLLALATELKTDMDKTTKDTLSMDVIRKADEIEKLAHAVKEKMKGP
jgi:hypothetical protein